MKFKHIAAVLAGAAALSAPSCDLNEKFFLFGGDPRHVLHLAREHLCRAVPPLHPLEVVHRRRPLVPPGTDDRRNDLSLTRRGLVQRRRVLPPALPHLVALIDRFVVNTYDGTTGGISRALEAKADLESVDYNAIGLSDAVKADHINQLNAITAYFYMKGLDYFGGMPIDHSVNDGLSPPQYGARNLPARRNAAQKRHSRPWRRNPRSEPRRTATSSRLPRRRCWPSSISTPKRTSARDTSTQCAQLSAATSSAAFTASNELDDTWYGPHTFDNDSSHEAIWNVPSENSKVEWSWYFKYFYHNSSYVYFDIETAGYNGFILTPSLNPQGSYYTQWKLGSPYRKFNDKDLRKKPYRYLGNKRYDGHVPLSASRSTSTIRPKCAWDRKSTAAKSSTWWIRWPACLGGGQRTPARWPN